MRLTLKVGDLLRFLSVHISSLQEVKETLTFPTLVIEIIETSYWNFSEHLMLEEEKSWEPVQARRGTCLTESNLHVLRPL